MTGSQEKKPGSLGIPEHSPMPSLATAFLWARVGEILSSLTHCPWGILATAASHPTWHRAELQGGGNGSGPQGTLLQGDKGSAGS